MISKMTGRAGAIAAAVTVALAVLVPATAASADAPSPVGRYRLTTTTVKSHLLVNADHTFQIVEFGDSGQWAQLGNVIALGISSGPDGNCVLMGTLTARGISGKAHPGAFSCGASAVFEMYAKRLPPKGGAVGVQRAGSLHAALGRQVRPAVADIDPTGKYTETQNGTSTGFVVESGHTALWPDLGETGSWAEFHDIAAFVVMSFTANRGCISLGRVHTTSINSAKAPGPSVCPGDVESTWFAHRLPA